MLSKDKRLNLKKDFEWVASGRKLETKYLKLFVSFGDNQMPRIGIAIPGRSFKKATERNKARRLTTSAFEALYSNLPATINIVALPKSGVVKVKSDDLLEELEAALKNEKIIN